MEENGNHWGCLYPSVEFFAEERLRPLIAEAEFVGSAALPEFDFDGCPADVVHLLQKSFGALAFGSLIVGSRQARENLFASAYPIAKQGVTHALEITNIYEWEDGIEAEITGATQFGGEVSFFDPFYAINKDQYRLGVTKTFSLAAFAYSLGAPPHEEFEIFDGAFYDLNVQEGKIRQGEGMKFVTTDLAALFPRKDLGVSEFEFQSPVKDIQRASFDGRDMTAIRATLMRDTDNDDEDFDAVVYAARHVLKDRFQFERGRPVSGVIWMQG